MDSSEKMIYPHCFSNIKQNKTINTMKKIILDKNDPMVDLTEFLSDTKLARNQKHKTYHYCALLSNYQSTHNIELEFYKVTDLTVTDEWNLSISKNFINNILINNIYEIVVNIKESYKYSSISKSYFVVKEKSEDSLFIEFYDTPYTAF